MYITKTLAMPTFEITDCIKIVDVKDYDGTTKCSFSNYPRVCVEVSY